MVCQVDRCGIWFFYKPHTFPSEKGTAFTLSPCNGGRLARFEPYQRCLTQHGCCPSFLTCFTLGNRNNRTLTS